MILLRHRLANSVSTYYVAKSLLYLTITILATRSSASSYESTLSFCDDETSTFAANYVSTEFNTSLSGLVETFQSWGGHTGAQQLKDIILNISSDELSSDNEQLQEYATDMVVFAVPGIVMFVLTFFFGIGMICARWCCPNSCCKPKKAINEYSCCERYWPMIALNIVACLAAVVAILAILSLDKVRTGTESTLCEMDALSYDISTSFGDLNTVSETFLADSHVANFVTIELNNYTASMVGGLSAQALTTIDNINAIHESAATPSGISRGQSTYATCTYDSASSIFADANVGATKSTVPYDGVAEIRESSCESVQDMMDAVNDLVDAAQDASNVAIEVYNFSRHDFPDIVETIDDFTTDKLEHWEKGSFAFFFFVFFAVVVAVGCVIAYVTPCKFDDKIAHGLLHCSWFSSWAFAAVLFLFCGLGIPIAIMFSDTCVILKDAPTDVETYFDSSFQCDPLRHMDACRVVSSCFEDPAPSFFALNMGTIDDSAYLNYAGASTVPDNTAMDAWTTSTADAVDVMETCIVDTIEADAVLEALNALTAPTTYTRTECWVGGGETAGSVYETEINGNGFCAPNGAHLSVDNAALTAARTDAIQTLRLEYHYLMDVQGGNLLTQLEHLSETMDQIESSLNGAYTADANAADAVASTRTAYETLKTETSAMDCQFVAPYYDDIVEGLCEEALNGFAYAALFMFLIAVLGWPQIVFSTYVSIRDFGSGHKRGGSAAVVPSSDYDGNY